MSSLRRLELVDGALSHVLGDVTVDGGRGEPACPQLLGQGLGLVLGADEDDHPLEVLDLEDPGEGVHLLRVGHDQVALGDVGGRRGLVANGDLGWVVQVLRRELPDLGGHRRREERDVLVRRGVRQDRLDVVGEAHVEHLVGLVEHQEPQLGQVEGALVQVVHDPAGRADDDVHSTAQRGELDAVPLPAVDREHAYAAQVGGVLLERLAHLERELTRRRQDQGLRRLLGQVEPGEDRQRERRGLAGPGLRQAHDVAALEQGGDGGRLDRRGGLVADVAQALPHLGGEPEVVERDRGGRWLFGHVSNGRGCDALSMIRRRGDVRHSTVTDLARLRGLSMSWPRCRAAW